MNRLFLLIAVPLLGSFAAAPNDQPEEGGTVVGPSVLMNARAHNEAAIFDLRPSGRRVPDAQPAVRFASGQQRAVFLLGSPAQCDRFAASRGLHSYFIVPPRMMEYEQLPGVPQLSPTEAQQKVERDKWPLFDISEAEEFAGSRLPHSTRLQYSDYESSKLLPRHKPFIVACRVGHRSQLVVERLRALGYDARNLNGGLWEWECAGLALEKGA
ncbi:rhodanese-like domain-containing protein [bacterium]|nr:MAG: rhodanese-like domain-containing protein [bacterium]